MTEDFPQPPLPNRSSSPFKPPSKRSSLTLDSSQPPHRTPRIPQAQDVPSSPTTVRRRRSSNFSDYSLNHARKSFASSTDSLLLPKVRDGDKGRGGSHWESAPLAFALLPAVGGMLFTNGSGVVTDVMLLGIAAVFLNWSVRLPWDWYHSAQELRKKEEYTSEAIMLDEESETDDALSFSQTTLEEVPEEASPLEQPTSKPFRKPAPALEAATNELYIHEMLALLSCFLFPMLGAYLLHTIRSQLSRPSEGLVSDYNLTIFLLASELRPLAHLVKLIQARTLHLQRVVAASTSSTSPSSPSTTLTLTTLTHRLASLETLTHSNSNIPSQNSTTPNPEQTSKLTSQVRATLQPELDALNRAVRRYEKRATLQAFQTDSRLQDLEGRLNDAVSLAAAVASTASYKRGFTGVVVEWVATAVVVPVQMLSWVVGMPGRVLTGVWGFGRRKVLGEKSIEREGRKSNRVGIGNERRDGRLKPGLGIGVGNGAGKKGFA